MRLLPAILDHSARLPLGFCRRYSTLSRAGGRSDWILSMPVLPWFARRYSINYDDYAEGWWLFRVMLLGRVDPSRGTGFELHVRWGWAPIRVTYENRGWPL